MRIESAAVEFDMPQRDFDELCERFWAFCDKRGEEGEELRRQMRQFIAIRNQIPPEARSWQHAARIWYERAVAKEAAEANA